MTDKFRGICNRSNNFCTHKKGVFVYGYHLASDDKHYIIDCCGVTGTAIALSSNVGDFPGYHEVIPETVGQSTGLKDKNDKEIYEGDYVRHTVSKTDGQRKWDETEEYEIKWEFIRWSIPYAFLPWGKNPKIKVLGNIHEHPELIK